MLTSRLQQIRDRTVAAVDRVFAEPIQLAFQKNGRADPARPVREIEAVLRVGGGEVTSAAGHSSRSWHTKIAAGKAELHIDLSKYADLYFVKGDSIRAIARRGEPWFEVLRVDDRGESRLILELGEK
ncbi:hypothetical protein [Rhizobium sp. RU36D]|uniref:hypothetical protein n=1 Tax=Rhizobium sp. RU36D TaxID=1907415 RepID=UPI0009D7B872|nr:hypothetical protein [Rhizobium sp. RU36D]SMD18143.1 hypothetical protein SAMN05880593_13425 [Rhizobium sp. RU36D]